MENRGKTLKTFKWCRSKTIATANARAVWMLANGVRGLAESLSLSPFNTASRSLEVAKRHPQKSLPREDWDQHCCTAGPVDSFDRIPLLFL